MFVLNNALKLLSLLKYRSHGQKLRGSSIGVIKFNKEEKMSNQEFVPPIYKETALLIFEKKTGKILATEQRWSLLQTDSMSKNISHSNLIKVIADNLEMADDELGMLVLDDPQALKTQIKKIDTKSRKPIFAKKSAGSKKQIIPPRFDKP